jgi:tetratricopeptide (TPR) repeat protein
MSKQAELQELLSDFRQSQVENARVIFACADLKVAANNEIKILEFGSGMDSGFEGLKRAYRKEIVDLLHDKFKEMGLPKLLLNGQPGFHLSDHSLLERELVENLCPVPVDFDPKRVADYALVYGGTEISQSGQNILLMDDACATFAFQDKAVMHTHFAKTGNLAARPRTLQFSSVYYEKLVEEVTLRLPGVDRFVLKAPDVEGGRGVVIVDRGELHAVLNSLLRVKNHPSASVFESSHSDCFLVEEYIASQPVEHAGALYDGTMRVPFVFVRDDSGLRCEPFSAYWKLPPSPISGSSLRECTVSSYSAGRIDSAGVDPIVEASVTSQLKAVLPAVLDSMIQFDVIKHIEEQASPSRRSYYLRHVSNSLAYRGSFVLAECLLNQAAPLIAEEIKYQLAHERGVLCHLQRQYNKAIQNYNRALVDNPFNAITYYRRALSYHELKDFTQRDKDFNKAIMFNPGNRNQVAIFHLVIKIKRARGEAARAAITSVVKTLNDQGVDCFQAADYELALLRFEAAISRARLFMELDKLLATALYNAGSACERMGRLPQAITYLKECYEMRMSSRTHDKKKLTQVKEKLLACHRKVKEHDMLAAGGGGAAEPAAVAVQQAELSMLAAKREGGWAVAKETNELAAKEAR